MSSEAGSGKVVALSGVDRALLKQARVEFRRWKDTFTAMIRRKSSIAWYRDGKGKITYKFILPTDLFKVIYEIQIQEKVKAQIEHAERQFRKTGRWALTRKEIEQQALKNLQREFMAASVSALEKICAAHQKDLEPELEKKDLEPELEKDPAPIEEEQARETLAKMREHLAAEERTVEDAMANIQAELDARADAAEKPDVSV